VSLIHEALRQAERAPVTGTQNSYNPLSAPLSQANAARSPLVILGGLLVCAAIAFVVWPLPESDSALAKPITQELKTSAIALGENVVTTPVAVKTSTAALRLDPAAQAVPASSFGEFGSSAAMADPALNAAPAPAIQSRASVIQDSKSLWQQQVEQAVATGDMEQAEVVLKQWLGAAPNDPVPRGWLARIYMGKGLYLAAEPLLNNPVDTESQALLGLVYERTDRPRLAAELFEQLYRLNPKHGRWLLFWAINSENSGQLAKSRTLYQTYLTLFGSEDEALTRFSQQRLTSIGTL
jgi:tetratricopeptide (TPR) repeat protein